MPKVISAKLDIDSLHAMVLELVDYRDRLKTKAKELEEKVGYAIAKDSAQGFTGAVADTTLDGGIVQADVSVEVTDADGKTVVKANGEDAIWAEFGAGVYYNGAAGASPNPFVAENNLPYKIGQWPGDDNHPGRGLGMRKTWSFKDADGVKHVTHGTPAKMPMYRADVGVRSEIPGLAEEVFSRD